MQLEPRQTGVGGGRCNHAHLNLHTQMPLPCKIPFARWKRTRWGVIRSNSLTFASRIIKNHELNHQVPSNLCTANTEFARTRPMPHWIIRFFSTCTRNECSVEFISFLSVCTRNKCQVKSKDLQDTGSQTQAYMVQACSPTPLPVMVMVPVLVMDCSPRLRCGNGGVSWSSSIFVSLYLCIFVSVYVCMYVRRCVCV
jgi:hypothetical protein